MALSAKLISFILLLSLLSSQIHARDSNFFSKVSHDKNVQETNNNVKDAQLTTKEKALEKQNPQPKQTLTSENENSYGLYGQENSQTTNYAPYITTADGGRIYDLDKDPLLKNQENMADTKFQEKHASYTPMTNQNDNYYYKGENGYHPDQKEDRFAGSSYTSEAYGDNYYNGHNRNGRNDQHNHFDEKPDFYYNGGNRYENQQQGQRFSDTRLADNGYSTMANQNNYPYNGGSDVPKQGLSDTRFLENGRYFYDISKDRYNPNQYDNYGEMSSRNEYNRNSYDNNEYNNKKNYEGGYQNQEEFEENNDQFMP